MIAREALEILEFALPLVQYHKSKGNIKKYEMWRLLRKTIRRMDPNAQVKEDTARVIEKEFGGFK